MSFLTRRALIVAPRASFSTSAYFRKSAAETVKDTVKTVDKAISSKIVDGIEVGEVAADKVKAAAGLSASEVKGKAAEVAGAAKGKAAEVAGQAKGKAAELEGEAKGKL